MLAYFSPKWQFHNVKLASLCRVTLELKQFITGSGVADAHCNHFPLISRGRYGSSSRLPGKTVTYLSVTHV